MWACSLKLIFVAFATDLVIMEWHVVPFGALFRILWWDGLRFRRQVEAGGSDVRRHNSRKEGTLKYNNH